MLFSAQAALNRRKMFDDAGSELTSKLLEDPVSIDIDDLFADAVGVRADTLG